MKRYLQVILIGIPILFSIGFGVQEQKSEFIKSLIAKLSTYQNVIPEEKVYLQLDRPFYTAGDDIWFKGYLTNGTNHEFSQLSDVAYVELINPKGAIVKKHRLLAETGIFNGDFTLDDNAPGGIYTIKAYSQWMKNGGDKTFFQKKIQVQKVLMPRLLMKLDFQEKAYGPGALVNAEVSIRTLEDEPLSNKTFEATAYVGGNKFFHNEFSTDEEGKVVASFKLPDNLSNNDGLLALKFEYEGTYESISRSIPIVLNHIDLQFFPESGDMIEGVAGQVAFKALNEFGKAADVTGEIKDEAGQVITTFKSYHAGMGSFELMPQKGKKYVAYIKSPVEIARPYPLPQALEEASSYAITVQNQSEDYAELTFYSPDEKTVHLVGQVRGQIYFDKTIEANQGTQSLKIPLKAFPTGIAQLTLFDRKGEPQCERLLFVNKHKKLNINLKTDKKQYGPREKVKVTIVTKDENDKPVPTNLSLAVVDDKVISFADDKQDNILSWMLMGSDLKGKVEEPNFYFKEDEPKADKALDLVMMTNGWRRFEWQDIQSGDYEVEFVAETEGVIQGRVINTRTKTPLKCKVYLAEGGGNGRMIEGQTDNNGEFTFVGVNPSKGVSLIAKSTKGGYYVTFQLSDEYERLPIASVNKNTDDKAVKPKVIKGEWVEVADDKSVVEGDFKNKTGLSSDDNVLEEVIVTGYGSFNRESSNISSTVVTVRSVAGDELSNTLSGRVAGVNIVDNTGVAGASSKISIRGSQSLTTINQPLYVVDGVPLSDASNDNGGNLNFINPNDIKSVSVLKGVAATAIYGSRGAYGVIVITTKRPGMMNGRKIYKYKNFAHRYIPARTHAKTRTFYAPAYDKKESDYQRIDFRQTIFWEPNIQTDKNGKAEISFYNSDATTVFRMTAEGVGINGQVARNEQTYHVEMPFSMETKIPPYLTFEDKLELPVILKNNSNRDIKGVLTTVAPVQLINLGDMKQEIVLAPNSAKTVYIPLLVKDIAGKGNLAIQFKSKNFKDAVVQEMEIVPKGFPVEMSISGVELDKKLAFTLADPVAGSIKSDFVAYRDVLGQLMDGLESIFRAPYGCFEQTSSSTYPNLLALNYLRESGKTKPEVEQLALEYIDKGYKRLVSFECNGGGYDWFGYGPASVWLTAYGLMEFNDMKAVYQHVNQKMVNRTWNWLSKQRDINGRFVANRSYYRTNDHYQKLTNAYVVFALATTGGKDLGKAFDLAMKDALKADDAYMMGLVANAAFALGKEEQGNILLEKLFAQIKTYGVEGMKARRSITYGYGRALQVEVASLTTLAILQTKSKHSDMLNKLVKFIASNNRFGGYGNTQATVMALKALVAYTKFTSNIAEDGVLEIAINNEVTKSIAYHKNQKKGIVLNNLGTYFGKGKQTLGISFKETTNAWPYSVDISYTSYTPQSSPACPVNLKTTLANGTTGMGETIRLTTSVKNKKSEHLGMVVALVGIPSGLSPQPWQLKELQEKRVFDYYEVRENYVVFYYTSMEANAENVVSLDLKAEVPGNYQAPASSAYLYYTDEFKDWEKGTTISVSK